MARRVGEVEEVRQTGGVETQLSIEQSDPSGVLAPNRPTLTAPQTRVVDGIGYTLGQILTPFASGEYRPFWVGIGQVGFYAWAILAATFYIRPVIGQKTWRFLHYGSFGMYLLGISHGIFSGTDASAPWAQNYYWISAGSLLFLLMYRILASMADKFFPQNKKPAAPAPRPTQG